MKLNHWLIGTRIAAQATLLLLLMTALTGVAWWSLQDAAQRQAQSNDQAKLAEMSINAARSAQVTFKTQVQEWKNILLRGGKAEAFDKYREGFRKEGRATQDHLKALKPLFGQMALPMASIDQAIDSHAQLMRQYEDALSHFDATNPDQSAHDVDVLVKGLDRAPTKQIDGVVDQVMAASVARLKDNATVSDARMKASTLTLGTLWLLAVLVGSSTSLVTMRSITKPLQRAVQTANDVAAGRIGQQTQVDGRDEVTQLITAMNQMSQSLQGVVSQVRESAQMVEHASSEIATGNLDLSSRTESQASNLQASAASIEQITNSVQHSADAALQARQLAQQASNMAEQGGQVVSHVVETMNTIHQSSSKIADITSVIDGIAFQTNILALNAAVEAARAGEQGRGFAVVASEVRALAQRSASAAQEIKGLINASVDRAQRGAALVNEAGTTIDQTVQAVREVQVVVAGMADSAKEQAAGVSQVSQSISSLDSTMQQNSALVEQAAAAANSLKEQARSLTRAVAFFSV